MKLSQNITDIKDQYEIVVIGSGYGGSIAASRMARAGRKVCLLEKGKEILTGDYPKKEKDILKNFHISYNHKSSGTENNLYQLHMYKEIGVFHGCGLGGTSLINANVSLPPEEWVFQDSLWPKGIRENLSDLYKNIGRAQSILEPNIYPENGDTERLAKVKAHQKSAEVTGGEFKLTPINVKFKDGLNAVGFYQFACNNCGDCVTGCNVGAKNTTQMNYLPDATRWGAEIYTECEVLTLIPQGSQWLINFKSFENGISYQILTDFVFLGAGTLGSTQILLQSKKNGLSLSDRIGERFTGNGDVLGFSYNSDQVINGIGRGDTAIDPMKASGPCIASVIDLRQGRAKEDQMVIQEGVIPGGMAKILPIAFLKLAKAVGDDTDQGFRDFLAEKIRELRSLTHGVYTGALRNTQTYLVMAHDSGAGKISYKNGKIRIEWSGVGDEEIFRKINGKLWEASSAIGGTFIPNPMWQEKMENKLVTVHPLGGCAMAEISEEGVVNHKGQVFSETSGKEVYPNLIVCDGSIIPKPLGVNPLLTISGLAEFICEQIANENQWTIDYRFSLGSMDI